LRRHDKMKPKQLLRFVLILFIIGTLITLFTGVLFDTYIPKVKVPSEYRIFSAITTEYGIPFPWISYSKIDFTRTDFPPLLPGAPLPPNFYGYSISYWTFYVLNFIGNVLLYTSIIFLIPLFDYLIKLILHWKYRKSNTLQRNLVLPQD
jgi:hypothetical protein